MPTPVKWTPEARERLRADVLAAVREIVARGDYPSLPAIEARLGVRGRVVSRARSELVASGDLDVEIKGKPDRERYREAREALKARLLRVLRDHAALGLYPSVRDLAGTFPPDERPREALLYSLRNELRDDGLYQLPSNRGGRPRVDAGLDDSTPESLKAIEATRLAIHAEKIGRGELPSTRTVRVYHTPDLRPRGYRR